MSVAHEHPSYWKTPIGAKERKSHGCLHCEAAGVVGITFRPEQVIAVGFGAACLTKNGRSVYDEQEAEHKGHDYMTGAQAEELAAKDPDHDWQIHIHGPLSGRVYQRQGAGNWVLIEQDEGFA